MKGGCIIQSSPTAKKNQSIFTRDDISLWNYFWGIIQTSQAHRSMKSLCHTEFLKKKKIYLSLCVWAAGAHAALPLTSLSQRGGFVNELADISRPKTPLIPSDTPCDKETSFSVDFPSARLCQEILQVNLL